MNTKNNFTVNFNETPFLETSYVASHIERLNWRSEVLLANNREAIANKRVLDLASHDGRFSYACLALGARHVTGVEGRAHLVSRADESLSSLGYAREKFHFVHADLFDYLQDVEPGSFDIILCFGVFYHMIKQVEFLRQISRIKPAHLILDTFVAKEHTEKVDFWRIHLALRRMIRAVGDTFRNRKRNAGCLVFKYERSQKDGATIDSSGLIAWPTGSLVEVLLRYYGFEFKDIDWHGQAIDDWSRIKDYKTGKRLSWIAQPT